MASPKPRRQVNGYIWNEQMRRVREALGAIRTITGEIIQALEQHPVAVRLLLVYAAQLALHLNAAAAALRELELIAQEQRESE